MYINVAASFSCLQKKTEDWRHWVLVDPQRRCRDRPDRISRNFECFVPAASSSIVLRRHEQSFDFQQQHQKDISTADFAYY